MIAPEAWFPGRSLFGGIVRIVDIAAQ